MSNLSITNLTSQNKVFNKNVAKVSVPLLLTGMALRPQPAKDSFEISNPKIVDRTKFINNFINSKEVENVIKTWDFAQYGKKGIPLAYSRDKFVNDIEKTLKKTDSPEETLAKYNLRKGQDIDGIANISDIIPETEEETKIQGFITKYYLNQTKIKDKSVNKVMNQLVSGMPEFTMTIGKVQHGTHIYSVDIHTLIVLQNCLNNPDYEKLSEEDKEILKLSVLMHDFGKNGKVVTPGHAAQSKIDAEMILKNYNLKPEIKERVLKQVENHHWFEKYNMGKSNEEDVKNIFQTSEDLAVAKIMAKADLEGISPTFHRQILDYGNYLTQEQFDKLFQEKIDKISF